MIGINHGKRYPDANRTLDQLGLTWMQSEKVMSES